MKKISYWFWFLLVVSVYSQEKESLPVVSEVKELKNIKEGRTTSLIGWMLCLCTSPLLLVVLMDFLVWNLLD